VSGGEPRPVDGEFVDEEAKPRARVVPIDRAKDVDEVFANARQIIEPVVEILYLGTAFTAAVVTAVKTAKKRAAARARKGR